ncbi:hypothetical protein [Streptomyces sp. NRRL S-350]|uniref:hypothetical protein n=1 Tax=Streptomyces sp. NRRL S-350 TaxID=1463902 RepID=UPI0004C23FCA|nr:hypothetical protein [Streptomyces sp. NRRL S-350]
MRRSAVAVVAAVLAVSAFSAPAADAATRSASACTHRGGPQVCIRIEGTGTHVDKVTAIWTNPPKGATDATAHLYLDGKEVHYPQKATRHGDTLSADWGWMEFSGRMCVDFDGVKDRRACEDVYDSNHS